ncbi:MAG: hypothetical protein WEB06_16935 [Actinomycetota bacterium]
MADPDVTKTRRRSPLVYTIALVLVLAAGATAVFLMGSSNRKNDRAALVSYEESLLPAVREAGRIVQQEMKPSLREIVEGTITGVQLLDRTGAWQRVFQRVRDDLLGLEPPALLGDIEAGWDAAMGAYLVTVDAFQTVGRADPGTLSAAVDQAVTIAENADKLFDRVAGVIQFHRRRLGLGASPNLPDPSPTPVG